MFADDLDRVPLTLGSGLGNLTTDNPVLIFLVSCRHRARGQDDRLKVFHDNQKG